MYSSGIAVAGAVLALSGPAAAASPPYIEVKLVAESAAPKAGHSILVGLQMNPRPGWHGYWSNPGESGLAPVVRWTAPRGVQFGPLQHPAPTLMRVMGMTSYVHTGPHLLLAWMNVDRKLAPETTLPITADVNWAACSDRLCVPEKARLSLVMKVGNGAPSADGGRLQRALAREPKRVASGSFTARGGQVVLIMPRSVHLQTERTRFFPDQNGFWNPLQARAIAGRPLMIVSRTSRKPPQRISGVVSDGSSAYRVTLGRERTRP